MKAFPAEPQSILAEGKTKKVWSGKTEDMVIVESKDDLTAGDGAKHDVVVGKAQLANQTTCNTFGLLKLCGVPVAYNCQLSTTCFSAEKCTMIPYEVVVRREAHGSFLKRMPGLCKGHVFSQLKLEFFLKTSGKKWLDYDLPTDDPLVVLENDQALLFRPDQPIAQQKPFLVLKNFPLKDRPDEIEKMGEMALKTFLIFEKAWQLLGRKLVDFKVEFGYNTSGELRLADVIDNDSWRVLDDGKYIDKQSYRDGESLDKVSAKYQLVANLTERFGLPRQQIIIWRASETDNLDSFHKAMEAYEIPSALVPMRSVTCSAHKQPVQACEQIAQLVQDTPDSVVIAYVGRSNGLGPVLAGQISVPVIAVPATFKEFPEDVWSSLRMPSDVPLATILDPKNAVLYALQILAMRNPKIYAELRLKQEKRLCNIVRL